MGITDVLENHRIGFFYRFGGPHEFSEGFGKFPLAKPNPAEAIHVGAVGGIKVDGLQDEALGLVEILITVGPHIAKIVARFR